MEAGKVCLRLLRTSEANKIAAKYKAGLGEIFVLSGSARCLGNYKPFIHTSLEGMPIRSLKVLDSHSWEDIVTSISSQIL